MSRCTCSSGRCHCGVCVSQAFAHATCVCHVVPGVLLAAGSRRAPRRPTAPCGTSLSFSSGEPGGTAPEPGRCRRRGPAAAAAARGRRPARPRRAAPGWPKATRCSRKMSIWPSMSRAALAGSKPATSCGTSCAELGPQRVDADPHESRRSFSAVVISLAPLTGAGSAYSAPWPRSTWCTPDLIRKSSMSPRCRLQPAVGCGDLLDGLAQQARADDPGQLVHRHGQRGDQRGGHAPAADAVVGGHLPVRRLVDEAVGERLVVLARCVVVLATSRCRPGTAPARRWTGACPRGSRRRAGRTGSRSASCPGGMTIRWCPG